MRPHKKGRPGVDDAPGRPGVSLYIADAADDVVTIRRLFCVGKNYLNGGRTATRGRAARASAEYQLDFWTVMAVGKAAFAASDKEAISRRHASIFDSS